MTDERSERDWMADRRDFVADHREALADEREEIANRREAATDAWERELNEQEERQRYLEEQMSALVLPGTPSVDGDGAYPSGGEAVALEREHARENRAQLRLERETAARLRREATSRRDGASSVTGLALAFADIAAHLFAADDFDEILTRIVEATVATVRGCRSASVTVQEERDRFRTATSTDESARGSDAAQYEVKQGPSLDALEESVVHAPSFPDPRWPKLGARLAESGVESAVSYQFGFASELASFSAALNSYAKDADSFDEEAREIGLVLAAHGSAAARAFSERESLEELGRRLHDALSSRDVIGQAKGILMERLKMTPEEAFDSLRRASQHLNVKLREVAMRLTETGEWEDPPPSGRVATRR